MSKLSTKMYKEFRDQLGAELKRVRLEQNLTLEDAALKLQKPRASFIASIESGKSKRFFLILTLCALYNKHLKISLVD